MYVVVRFIQDEDKRLHIVPMDAMESFYPKDDRDFDNKVLYNVFWEDEVAENTGTYRAQVLMLAGKIPLR